MKKMIQKVKRGFTLIELLVVISIIALLAALLFPVFGRTREIARRSSCQSNLKQIGLGIMQYTQDYDEAYPQIYAGAYPGRYRWMDGVDSYIKSSQVFNCPSDSDPAHKFVPVGTGNTTTPSATGAPTGFGSYCASNAYWGNATGGAEWGSPMSGAGGAANTTLRVYDPSTCMLIGEGNGSFQVAWKFNSTAPAAVDATTTPNSIHDTGVTGATWEGAIVAPHLDTTNVLFADGHVKPLRLTNLLEASTSPPTTGTWATPTNRAGLRYFTRWSD